MSTLMDQVYESEAASHPAPANNPAAPVDRPTLGRLQSSLVIVASLTVAGAVFGFALNRFGWAGLLIATWPALALAGGLGCLCHELLLRMRRPTRP